MAALKEGSSKAPSGIIMHLLRCLSFFSAHFQCPFSSAHVSGFCKHAVNVIFMHAAIILLLLIGIVCYVCRCLFDLSADHDKEDG